MASKIQRGMSKTQPEGQRSIQLTAYSTVGRGRTAGCLLNPHIARAPADLERGEGGSSHRVCVNHIAWAKYHLDAVV